MPYSVQILWCWHFGDGIHSVHSFCWCGDIWYCLLSIVIVIIDILKYYWTFLFYIWWWLFCSFHSVDDYLFYIALEGMMMIHLLFWLLLLLLLEGRYIVGVCSMTFTYFFTVMFIQYWASEAFQWLLWLTFIGLYCPLLCGLFSRVSVDDEWFCCCCDDAYDLEIPFGSISIVEGILKVFYWWLYIDYLLIFYSVMGWCCSDTADLSLLEAHGRKQVAARRNFPFLLTFSWKSLSFQWHSVTFLMQSDCVGILTFSDDTWFSPVLPGTIGILLLLMEICCCYRWPVTFIPLCSDTWWFHSVRPDLWCDPRWHSIVDATMLLLLLMIHSVMHCVDDDILLPLLFYDILHLFLHSVDVLIHFCSILFY